MTAVQRVRSLAGGRPAHGLRSIAFVELLGLQRRQRSVSRTLQTLPLGALMSNALGGPTGRAAAHPQAVQNRRARVSGPSLEEES